MAKQSISLGTAPTGAGGDDSRSAMVKINSNFDELYAGFGGTIPAGSAAAAPIVGTTSAIFQRGSSANGEWIRFQDGTQICWGTKTSPTIPANGLTTATAITLPVSFLNTSYTLTASCQPVNTYDHYGVTSAQIMTDTTANLYVRNGATAQAFAVAWQAIGRWK